MKDLNIFQIILLCVFGFAGIIAVLVFGGFLPGFKSASVGATGTATVWGTIPSVQLAEFLSYIGNNYKDSFSIKYVYQRPAELEANLLEAIASGQGPDIVMMPQDLLLKHSNKITIIPYSTLSARDFQDTYFDGADILLKSDGVMALPILVDPLVMFYNKDLFSADNIASPPTTWSSFLKAQMTLTKKDAIGNILQSGVAMGEAGNITNFKSILSALFLQSGDKITSWDDKGRLEVDLGSSANTGGQQTVVVGPAEAALSFFTQFSDQSKETYGWNRSLPNDQEAFYGGTLATYFGFASEVNSIAEKNPHLYFDIAQLPQRDNSNSKLTSGRLITLAIMASSQKTAVAYAVVSALASADLAPRLATVAGVAPARRDLLAVIKPSDPKQAVIYKSALISRAWLDPEPAKTRRIFSEMIEAATVGRMSASSAVGGANSEMLNLVQ